MDKPIYLDYNATTPIDPRVAEAMLPYINEHFGNPSSSHYFGTAAKKAVGTARAQVAAMLGCQPHEIIFTSGGSESNNLAIKGAATSLSEKGNHIITSQIEHPAVSEVCRFLETRGYKITQLPVDADGLLDPAAVAEAITPQTILITIMHANNEVGTIQPIAEIAAIARENNILIHSDCAQSIGKIPVKVDDLGVDLLSIAGHKLYAPKGIGALYIRGGVKLEKQIHGADHEMNLRAGTENVIEIVGLGRACSLIGDDIGKHSAHLRKLRDRLEQGILRRFPQCRINGHRERRLPNTSSISFPGIEAQTIVAELSDHVAVSAGAACHSESIDVSAVLQAMIVPLEFAMGTIRFSVGRFTTVDEIDRAVRRIIGVVEKLQPQQGPSGSPQQDSGQIKLTRFTHGLGCACKLRPQLLEAVLSTFPPASDSRVLVGNDSSDDAAVYQIDNQTAIVQTVDFFTPVVDDPFDFGRIAAANSLSDIYAMGARPLFALNVVGFPSNRLPVTVLEQILAGARSIAEKAGISIIGGHTVDDSEPKFGLAVTGTVHPDKIIRNSGARPGDDLILTKPLGTGVLSTALKRGLLNDEQRSLLVENMAGLNREAAGAMQQVGVQACTDVTGFGLLGHLLEMLQEEGICAELNRADIPFLTGAEQLAAAGNIPGGTRDNYEFTRKVVAFADGVPELGRLLLNDAQTSGGLLIAVDPGKSGHLLDELHRQGIAQACKIGSFKTRGQFKIEVR